MAVLKNIFSLRIKFIAAISVILAVTLSLTAMYGHRVQERLLLESLDERLRSLGTFTALISPESLYTFDITTLDRFVEQINADPDIRYAVITNPAGVVITTVRPKDITLEDINKDLADGPRTDHVHLQRFVINDGGEHLGTVVICVDLERMQDLTRQNLYEQLLLYLAIIVFLGSVIFFVFHLNVLRPVYSLIAGASKVSEGRYDAVVPVTTSDELGRLAECFNYMTSKISVEQSELHDLNDALLKEIEIRKTTEMALYDAKETAENASKAKSEFLASMSHELRTPLNSIIGFAEMMKYEVKGPLTLEYREYTDLITCSGRLLLETVNSILDIAKIEAGKFELYREPVFMGALVDEVVTLMDVQAQDKGIALKNETHDMRCLVVDSMRMKQVFLNIIGNAIKFTNTGEVTIENHCNELGHNILVTDTGIGMSPDQIELALKPFSQVHGTVLTRRFQGTGLGLSFSSQIMKLHGGELTITSEEHKGTTVTLHFPPDLGDDQALAS